MPNYDAIIIGTGQAGPALARRLAAAGSKVAIMERKLFGGTCVNTGCTPTKTLVASAYAAHIARRAADDIDDIATRLLEQFPLEGVTVQLRKLLPPIDGVLAHAAVEISRDRQNHLQ